MAARNELPPDTVLGGKIRLIRRIGRGGMGDVWFARNEATQADLAVKTLLRSERTSEHDERFRREARLSATISHRNVVRVFDLLDEPDGTLGLVMELLRGSTLEDVMRERGPIPTRQAIAMAVPVLSAMHHVHQKGIVHRDVKPANVFFAVEPDGHVIPKILDFGIAKIPAAGTALTMDGSVLGTPHYMSPEQIRSQDMDARSDMFSMAVVVYEMLTGVRLFQRDTAAASLAAVLEHEADPDPRIDPRVWVVLSRALAKRPYERYSSCAELAKELRGAIDATDDDLAHALQELRPSGEVPAPPDATDPSAALPTHHEIVLPQGRYSVPVVVGLGAAVAMLVLVVIAALRRPAEPPTMSGAVEAVASATAPFGGAPPPRTDPPPPPAPIETAVATPAASAVDIDPSPPSSSPAAPRGAVKKPAPAPLEKKPKPRGNVATTPGF